MKNSKERFSDRVGDYVRFRPSYPHDVVDLLKAQFGLTSESVIVDVGSGTGISSELFLKNKNKVFGVEPNSAMRTAAEECLKNYSDFQSIHGSSEKTNLLDRTADFIIVAQAFHWFSPLETKLEFQRILKPKGIIVILFNDRDTKGSDFAVEYENLLNEFGTDYKEVKHKNSLEQRHRDFLGNFKEFQFPNPQSFDFEGLKGRLASSSYAPKDGQGKYSKMVQKLHEIFLRNQKDGFVVMEHTTRVFVQI